MKLLLLIIAFNIAFTHFTFPEEKGHKCYHDEIQQKLYADLPDSNEKLNSPELKNGLYSIDTKLHSDIMAIQYQGLKQQKPQEGSTLYKEGRFYKYNETRRKFYLSEKWQGMRVTFDYSSAFKSFSKEVQDYIKTKILNPLAKKLQSTLKVKRYMGVFQPISTCWGLKFNQQTYQNTDYLIIITMDNNKNAKYVAYAAACQIDPGNFRPVAGLINLNLHYMLKGGSVKTSQDAKFIRLNRLVVFHETTHALGFSSNLYQFYQHPNLTQRHYHNVIKIKNVTWYPYTQVELATPNALKFAQDHFQCSSLTGITLEMSGGRGSAGSHWELSDLGNDIMTPRIEKHFAVSNITLGLLEDTGWYKPSYQKADYLWWGKSKKCQFLNQNCPVGSGEFCNQPGAFGCSVQGDIKDYCVTYQTSDFYEGCSVYRPIPHTLLGDCNSKHITQKTSQNLFGVNDYDYIIQKQFKEKKGLQSKCFQYKNATNLFYKQLSQDSPTELTYFPVCYQFKCNSDKTVTVYIDGQSYLCSQQNQVIDIPNQTGKLICPIRFDAFCGEAESQFIQSIQVPNVEQGIKIEKEVNMEDDNSKDKGNNLLIVLIVTVVLLMVVVFVIHKRRKQQQEQQFEEQYEMTA